MELVAHLGDFREGRLEDLCDGSNSVMDQALKVCCWLNTMEREKFSKPWEVKDSEEKFEWCAADEILCSRRDDRHSAQSKAVLCSSITILRNDKGRERGREKERERERES